jgi:thioredoxin reductase (NADPH)
MKHEVKMHDCIVIGAGPAGLTAALYLGRYRRDCLVIHDNTARAARIPLTHNVPGFPDGINGADLLDRMTRHASEYGAIFHEAEVSSIDSFGEYFSVFTRNNEPFAARTVILATGILLNQIDLPHAVHEQAIADNVLRYCAVCDAYEHIDRRIGVVGCEESGASQALFLSRYSDKVILVPDNAESLSDDDRRKLAANGVAICEQSMVDIEPRSTEMLLWAGGGNDPYRFDVIYPCFGTRPRTELARQLGLALDDGDCLPPQSHFETDVPGFFASGDIIRGLDQISVAMGHGAIAATQVHSLLRERDGEI